MLQFVMPLASSSEIKDFNALDEFTQGYIEAMFWTECNSDNPELEDKTFGDLAPDALIQIQTDCAGFQRVATELTLAYERGYNEHQAGVDFWLTRNGHGAGYWDRKELKDDNLGDRLTERAKGFCERDVYAGDDGKVYLS